MAKPSVDKQLLSNHLRHAGSLNKVRYFGWVVGLFSFTVQSRQLLVDQGRERDVAAEGDGEKMGETS